MSAGGPGRDTAYDGQWSDSMNYYVLPPLIGLPFDEMVRNGEGARHGYNKRYQTLIIVHAVFMAIPFLLLLPLAIYYARYMKPTNPRKAIQLHAILNTTVLVFLTIGFLAGWFAMNKGEWGANPHHIIGATVYGGAVVQAFFGFVLRQGEKNKMRKMGRVGLRAMLHAWLGRGLLALGLAQIPLGLFVYGAQMGFFAAYAAVAFLLFVGWFVCEYVHSRRNARYAVGSVRGGHALPEPSGGSGSGRRGSHSAVSYTEMTETTHPAPTTATPGTFASGTSGYDDHPTDYTSTAGTRLPASAQMVPLGSPSPRVGRLNRLSQTLGNRWKRGLAGLDGGGHGGGPGTDYSYDASTRPQTTSTMHPSGVTGLHAPPSQQQQHPVRAGGKIATLGDLSSKAGADPHHFRRNDLSDLKDSTPGDLSLPSAGVSTLSPVSSATTTGVGAGGNPLPRPQSDVSSLTSDPNLAGRFVTLIPPPPRPAGSGADSYLSDTGPASPPPPSGAQRKYHTIHPPQPGPRIPLPMPPTTSASASGTTSTSYRAHHTHRRIPSDTSTLPDAVIRIPLSRTAGSEAININHGELIRNNLAPGETPNVSVQVKVDRTGKSVTVRRVPEEEARMQRARERAARAGEREREIEIESEATSALLRNPAPVPVTPAKKPAAAGVLQQRKVVESDLSETESEEDSYLDHHHDDHHGGGGGRAGQRPPTRQAESSVGGGSRAGGNGNGGRESVVSAGAQTDDAEAEERIRERRRRKRREERKEGGLAGGAQGGGGTYYGDGSGGGGGGSGVGSGAGGAAARNIEWT